MTKIKNKVVIDTGVLVSSFAFGGLPEKAVIKAFAEAELYVSLELLKEYRDVPIELKAKRKIDQKQLKALISGIAAFVTKAHMVRPRKRIKACRDIKDNMLLECCLESKAKYLITGDKDLLDIDFLPFKLTILTPKEFIET